MHDPIDPSDDEEGLDDPEDSESDIGLQDVEDSGPSEANGQANGGSGDSTKKDEEANKKTEKRKNRGMMQWKPVRVIFSSKIFKT